MSISFFSFLTIANLNNNIANMIKGIDINIIVILNGLLLIDINCWLAGGVKFH